MRVLDKNYVTPALRKYDLIKLNADGIMMTRSLAENYPYTKLYKAQVRGAREHWLNIVEALESGRTEASSTLKYLIFLLLDKTSRFGFLSSELEKISRAFLSKDTSLDKVKRVVFSHIEKSDHAARLMEISMHALMQASIKTGTFEGLELRPLSQMRSSNKKHGNIGARPFFLIHKQGIHFL